MQCLYAAMGVRLVSLPRCATTSAWHGYRTWYRGSARPPLVPLPPFGQNRRGAGPAASATRTIVSPVAALRLWQRTTEGELPATLHARPNVRSVAFVRSTQGRRASGNARSLRRQSPSENPSRQPIGGSTVPGAAKSKIAQRTDAEEVECRRSPGTGLSAHKAARSGCKAASLPQAAPPFPGLEIGPARGEHPRHSYTHLF